MDDTNNSGGLPEKRKVMGFRNPTHDYINRLVRFYLKWVAVSFVIAVVLEQVMNSAWGISTFCILAMFGIGAVYAKHEMDKSKWRG